MDLPISGQELDELTRPHITALASVYEAADISMMLGHLDREDGTHVVFCCIPVADSADAGPLVDAIGEAVLSTLGLDDDIEHIEL